MKNIDLGLLIIRLTVGILMLFHGIDKILNGVDGIANMLESKDLPGLLAYGVYIGEVVIPLVIMIGWRTRIAALILFINMIFAVFVAHLDWVFALSETGGWKSELGGFYLFLSVALFFTGAGKYALSSKNKWD